MSDATPVEIRRVEDREIHVTWADGRRSVFSNKGLRERCPCAGCVHELTGRRLLDPASVRPDIRADEIALVGRYAIRVRWSDGHSTGIYTFDKLREWDPGAGP
jgi:ATP-binding protein involved in chromosome partitioning